MPDIRFDQSAVNGTVNGSRDDIVIGAVVTVNALSVTGTAVFGLLYRPAGSTATLTGAGATRSITPDVSGTYRIRITDDAPSSVIHTFTVLSDEATPESTPLALHASAHNERANAQANAVDTDPGTWVNESETNEDATSFQGWSPAGERNVQRIDAFMRIDAPVSGLHIANDGAAPDTIVNIAPGNCVSADGTYAIFSAAQIDPDISTSGAGGLFTGAVAAGTWYAVFVIADSSNGALSAGFDTDADAANRPAPFDQYRRLGWVRTDGAADIRTFNMPANQGRNRWVYWLTETLLLAGGTATTFTDTTTAAATAVAPTAVRQQATIQSFKVGGGQNASRSVMIPDGWDESGSGSAWRTNSGFSGGPDPTTNNTVVMPVGPTRTIRYLVAPSGDASATIGLNGWEDVI